MSYGSRNKIPVMIIDEIERVFTKHQIPFPYILYRTDTLSKFIGEAPHNLLPSQRNKNSQKGWTFYIAFAGSSLSVDGIDKIIVFPDVSENEIPLQVVVRLGKDNKPDLKKADLNKMPNKFVVRHLIDLDKQVSEMYYTNE